MSPSGLGSAQAFRLRSGFLANHESRSRFLFPKAIPKCLFHNLAEDVDMSVTDLPCADLPSLDNVRVLEAVQFR